MKLEIAAILFGLGLASASPFHLHANKQREVPQEQSHSKFLALVRTSLNLNNPLKIVDPVFGLLGNAAAAGGAGAVTDLDCLQQETADQAFTNAKKIGDIPGMAGALVYRAVERNTGKVGLASVLCTQTPVNPEIGALTQHQDPASDNAAAINKGIALALAKQLAAIGADPLLALESGTFAPGTIGDPTAAGNTCDTDNDDPGCIFKQKLLVLDATEEEISAAVAGISQTFTGTGAISATDIDFAGLPVAAGAGGASDATTVAATSAAPVDAQTTAAVPTECAAVDSSSSAAAPVSSCTVITTTVAASVASTLAVITTSAAAAAPTSIASGSNIQSFTGSLGGLPPPVISASGDRPFTVNGNTFVNAAAAFQRSCAIQNNKCGDAVNSGALAGSVKDCNAQEDECNKFDGVTKKKRSLDFGTCGSPAIVFEAGLDGRNTEAFIAEDQDSFNHGSALNIAVIAGFICQRLGSPCGAPTDVQASCTSASAAAVATSQNQAAADVFNSILGVSAGGATGATTGAAAAPVETKTAASVVVMTITTCV